MNELTETEKAYIAGFFDGEGCIRIDLNRPRGYYSYQLVLTMAQKHSLVLEKIRDMVGFGQVKISGKTYVGRYVCVSRQAYFLLKAIRPYLIVKSDQVDMAIQFQESIWNKTSTQEDRKKTMGLLSDMKRVS